MTRKATTRALTALLITTGAFAFAQPSIDWSTVDGGGDMFTAGGAVQLSGTIGQPDAGVVLTGGSLTLRGGFWAAAAPVVCNCLGDMNGDTLLNGADVAAFVNCALSGGACPCAELDGVPGLSDDDIAMFVNGLLSGAACP